MFFDGRIEEQCECVPESDTAAPLAGLPVRQALARFEEQSLRSGFASETLVLHRIVQAEVNRFPEIGVLFIDTVQNGTLRHSRIIF